MRAPIAVRVSRGGYKWGGGTLSSDIGYIRRVGTSPRAVKAVRSVRAEKVSRVVRKQKQREQ